MQKGRKVQEMSKIHERRKVQEIIKCRKGGKFMKEENTGKGERPE